MAQEISTVREAVRLMGGYAAVAEVADVSYEAACNWARANQFPPRTYIAFKRALADKGVRAPDSLWGMISASDGAEAAE